MQLSDSAKHGVDALSVATVLGTLANYLPAIAALFTIIWTVIRIYETRTVQNTLARWFPSRWAPVSRSRDDDGNA